MATPKGTPLDAERARLREAGYTDDEISKYFVDRLRGGSQQSAGAAPAQGNMTGVLGNASAALAHARGAIFGIRADIRNVFNSAAAPLERAMSGGFLAFKAAIIVVLGYAIYQEWQQHIVSATATAANNAAISGGEAAAASAKFKSPVDGDVTAPPELPSPVHTPKQRDWHSG